MVDGSAPTAGRRRTDRARRLMRRSGTAPNVILTGIPRSGTTLVCHLINTLPDSIALHEPMRVHELVVGDHLAATDIVARFFAQTRASLLADGTAPSKHVGRRIPDRHVSDHPSEDGLRRDDSSYGTVSFTKALTPDFLLVLKHPSAFTALLEMLRRRDTRPSRSSATRSQSSAPGTACRWGSATATPRSRSNSIRRCIGPCKLTQDRLDRQIVLLAWFFRQYKNNLPSQRVSPLRRDRLVRSGVSWPQSLHPPRSLRHRCGARTRARCMTPRSWMSRENPLVGTPTARTGISIHARRLPSLFRSMMRSLRPDIGRLWRSLRQRRTAGRARRRGVPPAPTRRLPGDRALVRPVSSVRHAHDGAL